MSFKPQASSLKPQASSFKRYGAECLVACSLWLAAVLLPLSAFAQKPLTRVLFVFDASNSMNAFWGNQPKIDGAREILLNSLAEIEDTPDLELALRLYGHQTPLEPGKQDCDDTKLEIPFGPDNAEAIRQRMKTIRCLGTTPIARSLEKAGGDFPECRTCRNVIILITDGIEACDEDPCAVSRALQAKGIILKPFVIGIGLEEASKFTFECVGNYYDAGTPEMFDHVLKIVIGQALNTTTVQVHLLDDHGKPSETDVPVTFYDQKSGAVRNHFVHTITMQGKPDTLSIDPVFTYRVVAHTLPPVVKENVTIAPGTNTIIALDAGQGELELKLSGGHPEGNVECIVRRKGDPSTLHVQEMNTRERYLTDTYDLEALTLPRTMINDVVIQQGATTVVQLPQPGTLNLQFSTPGHGGIFLKDGNELRWVAALDGRSMNALYRLQPGEYRVLYRSINSRQTVYSIEKSASIQSDRTITLNF